MKARYTALIAAIYVLPVLMVSSHGINKSPNATSTTESHPTSASNTTIATTKPAYQWVPYTTGMWNDTRLVQIVEYPSSILVVARAISNEGVKYPCVAIIDYHHQGIRFHLDFLENNSRLEVLLIESGDKKWISSSNGTILNNAIEGGNFENEKVFVCRINIRNVRYVGWMRPSTRKCHDSFDFRSYETYDLLVYEM